MGEPEKKISEAVLAEFDRAITDYKDEKRFIHTKYLGDFIRENPEKFPLLSQIRQKTALETRLTGCFLARKDFSRFRRGARVGCGAIWKRLDDGAGGLYISSDKASPDD